jgi:hypothetical protein
MGQLINNSNQGDPLASASVAAFETVEDANRFVQQGFQVGNLTVVYGPDQFPRGCTIRTPGDVNPYDVFYYTNDSGNQVVAAISGISGSLDLAMGSWGGQFLLTPAQ